MHSPCVWVLLALQEEQKVLWMSLPGMTVWLSAHTEWVWHLAVLEDTLEKKPLSHCAHSTSRSRVPDTHHGPR